MPEVGVAFVIPIVDGIPIIFAPDGYLSDSRDPNILWFQNSGSTQSPHRFSNPVL
jgi:hypothetical protein